MVAVKGLSTFKRSGAGEREARKIGGVRSLKVYSEDDKDQIGVRARDRVAPADVKVKSIPVTAETRQIANLQKEALNKLDKIYGKSINSAQTKVGRKALADIGNSRAILQKNEAVDGRQKLSRVVTKDSKVFNGNPRTRLHDKENIGAVTRKSSKIYCPPQRKSLPVLKRVDKVDNTDIKKINLENEVKNKEKHGFSVKPKVNTTVVPHAGRRSLPVLKHADKANLNNKVKNKDKYGFSVKPKVGTNVVPQVSNARDYRLKNRVSDGFIKMSSQGLPMAGDAKRLSRMSMKPTVKITAGIPRAQRASISTSVSTKSTSGTLVLSKQKDAASRCSYSKSTDSISCKKNTDASTSGITAKGKPGRRKSYTSLLIESTKLLKDHGNATKEETLPQIYDDNNQLEVAEYVDEIYQHYWVAEAHHQSLKNYMEIQTDITPQTRGILINWLIEVHLKFDLMQETLYLMVTLLDYYLSAVDIKKNEMQLVGLTSLLLASKYEDYWHPKVMELIGISAETYTRDQMLGMETTILRKLNFRLNLPTPYVFMLRFLKAAQGGKKFEKLAFFLIELCLVEYDALHFKPSLLCASAIYLARCTLHLTPAWTPLLRKHSHYEEFQIRYCAEVILGFHQAARKALLRVTYDKFMSADNGKVASIKPLDRLPPS
ncbi:cyclin b3,1 [Artemisia annua]|uniref:Cyclin b3,1 n=1 Tax=Artemisia annua TaxID=35608 RepID=A0A2U1L670_ARTAN|nr:cyclin b3,1 [Artemisia annua]